VTQRRDGGLHLLDVPQIHSALAQLPDDDFSQPAQPRSVLSRQRDLLLLRDDFRDASLEIEAGRQFLTRLIQGIINLLRVHF
jgi:hypothetical protein